MKNLRFLFIFVASCAAVGYVVQVLNWPTICGAFLGGATASIIIKLRQEGVI